MLTGALAAGNYVEVQIAGLRVAVATEYVQAALQRPAALTPLGAPPAPLLGAFRYGDIAVPLVDARSLLGLAADGVCAYVLIVAQAGRLVGLAVDRVCGLRAIAPEQVARLRQDEAPEAFFRCVANLPDTPGLLNVLEPVRLMDWVRAWTGSAPAVPPAAPAGGALAAQGDTLALASFALGGHHYALPAAMVAEVVPMPALTPLPGCGPLSSVAVWRGQHLCILDRRELDAGGPSAAAMLAVLLIEGCHIGVPVDAILAVWDARRDAIERHQRPPGAHSLVMGQVAAAAGPPHLLLDTDVLKHILPPLASETLQAALQQQQYNPEGYVVCDTGEILAVPMSSILTIVPIPAGFVAATPAIEGHIGHFHWQGRDAPIIALGAPDLAWTHLILVNHGADCRALATRRLVGMVHAYTSKLINFSMLGCAARPLVMVDTDQQRASYRLLEW